MPAYGVLLPVATATSRPTLTAVGPHRAVVGEAAVTLSLAHEDRRRRDDVVNLRTEIETLGPGLGLQLDRRLTDRAALALGYGSRGNAARAALPQLPSAGPAFRAPLQLPDSPEGRRSVLRMSLGALLPWGGAARADDPRDPHGSRSATVTALHAPTPAGPAEAASHEEEDDEDDDDGGGVHGVALALW